MSLYDRIVRIVRESRYHDFTVGEHVRLKSHGPDFDDEYNAEKLDSSDFWFIVREDFEFINEDEMRGFDKALGRTVASVDASSVNVVHITFTDGFVLSVDSESSHYGIPVIQAVNTY